MRTMEIVVCALKSTVYKMKYALIDILYLLGFLSIMCALVYISVLVTGLVTVTYGFTGLAITSVIMLVLLLFFMTLVEELIKIIDK